MSEIDWAGAHRAMDEAMQGMVPADLKAKGWIYKDMPGGYRLTHDAWELFLDLMGEGEYRCIAMTSTTDKYGVPCKRGQFFVSPQGMENLRNKDRLADLRAARGTKS